MIATHNIKVNGQWYAAGEVLPEPEPKQEAMELPAEAPAETVAAEVPAETAKPKATRRKKVSE